MSEAATLYVDGASLGNPGPSGIGVVLARGDEVVAEISEDAGWGTNNQAEYRALIRGLREALERGFGALEVCADSELLVRQMNGAYRVRSPSLRPLASQARELVERFERVEVRHVRRDYNERADALAKAGAEAARRKGAW